MGLLSTLLLVLSSGAGAIYEFVKTCNIFGIGQVCSSVPVEKLVVSLTSLATLSISEVRMIVQPPSITPSLCTLIKEALTPTPTSVYSLATAVT